MTVEIVLDERKWAKRMIITRSLGKSPGETLRRVARYYIDSGYKKSEVRDMLDAFILQCDPNASLVKWSDRADKSLSAAFKRETVRIKHIDISVQDMKMIRVLEGRQLRRLAFTLLCLSKYWDAIKNTDAHWVDTPVSNIMGMANIDTSIRRRSQMFKRLCDAGMIEFSNRVDNTSVRVVFSQDGETAVTVRDMRNLGYQYNAACGEEGYYVCERCGITTKKTDIGRSGGRPRKYCQSCSVCSVTKEKVDSTMRLDSSLR